MFPKKEGKKFIKRKKRKEKRKRKKEKRKKKKEKKRKRKKKKKKKKEKEKKKTENRKKKKRGKKLVIFSQFCLGFAFMLYLMLTEMRVQILFERGKRKKKDWVLLSRTGCCLPPIHRCCPTTVGRGNFCLLCFHPGPIRSSLCNLVNLGSPESTILTLNLAWTPDLHRTTDPRIPALKPFTNPSLQAAGLQACATTPGWLRKRKIRLVYPLIASLSLYRKWR